MCVVKTSDINQSEIEKFSKIIISPGPGLPENFPNLMRIIKSFAGITPILGICLGHQAIAKFLDANLKQISPVIHGQAHTIKVIKPSPLFINIPSNFKVGLYHSWAVNFDNIPEQINITSISKNNTIMSIENREQKLFGVQFHPESHMTEFGDRLIKNFINSDL